jgi:hypothetical protein
MAQSDPRVTSQSANLWSERVKLGFAMVNTIKQFMKE